jgi:hypothetical protein
MRCPLILLTNIVVDTELGLPETFRNETVCNPDYAISSGEFQIEKGRNLNGNTCKGLHEGQPGQDA